jgi:uncharacterized membrane protein YdbT with pleckstrin-like domain
MKQTPTVGLEKNEEIRHFLKPTARAYTGWYILGVMLTVAFGLGLLILLIAETRRRGRKYWLTNIRVIYEFRWLGRTVREAMWARITDVTTSQGVIARLLNYGNVLLNTAGTGFSGITLDGVGDAIAVREMVVRLMFSPK